MELNFEKNAIKSLLPVVAMVVFFGTCTFSQSLPHFILKPSKILISVRKQTNKPMTQCVHYCVQCTIVLHASTIRQQSVIGTQLDETNVTGSEKRDHLKLSY